MNHIVKWLVSVGAGLAVCTQINHILKTANDDTRPPIRADISSAVSIGVDEQYIMGSEEISSALQKILSSEEAVVNQTLLVGAVQDKYSSGCTLGSEALDRMLAEMLARSTIENTELPHIEPVMHL